MAIQGVRRLIGNRLPQPTPHLRAPRALSNFVIGLCACGPVAIVVLVLIEGERALPTLNPAVGALALLTVMGEFVTIRVFRRGAEGEITLSTAFAFAVLITGGPVAAAAVLALSSGLADVLARKPVQRICFNASQYVLATTVAGAILAGLTDIPHEGGPAFVAGDLAAIGVASIGFFIVNSACVTTVIALASGYSLGAYFRSDFRFVAESAGLALALAPVAVLTAEFSFLLAPTLALPLIAVHRAAQRALELEHQSLHDALTGLPNRAMLRERLECAIAQGDKDGVKVAVLLLDLDHFKEINDTLGHLHGDNLLVEIAHRLRTAGRADDTVARLGGDEFAVVLSPVHDVDDALLLAERLRVSLDEPIDIDGVVIRTEASIGVALAPDHGEDSETVLRRADIAMYVAKGGKTGVEV